MINMLVLVHSAQQARDWFTRYAAGGQLKQQRLSHTPFEGYLAGGQLRVTFCQLDDHSLMAGRQFDLMFDLTSKPRGLFEPVPRLGKTAGDFLVLIRRAG